MSLLLSVLSAALTAAVSLSTPPTAPVAVFATWDGDPTTIVSIDWHLEAGTDIDALEMRGPGQPEWTRVAGQPIRFPHSQRTVRRARITGLTPDATYELRIGDAAPFTYRTMPAALTRPVVFATGGDTQADEARFGVTNRMVAARDVDFVLIGGDLAYSNGDPRLVRREEQWFETASASLRTRDGRLIPLISAIGNHEIYLGTDTAAATRQMLDTAGVRFGDATYYGALHAHAAGRGTRGVPNYRAFDVGSYLSVVLLDTDHSAPVAGAQTDWLRETLAARAATPWVFPIYHVPAYPSVRSFAGSTSARVREHWVPLFEAAGLGVVFENHDHAYKRTHPLRRGQRDATGVVYVGDGAWGAGPRVLGLYQQDEDPWYIARAASVNHAIFVTLGERVAQLEVVESSGVTIDRLAITRPATR